MLCRGEDDNQGTQCINYPDSISNFEEVRRPPEGREAAEKDSIPPASMLFSFDPNTVAYHDLLRLGFTSGEALGIVKFRERGKVFEIAEDFAACYQVSEAMYKKLEPYIVIGEGFRLKKFASQNRVSSETRVAPEGGGGDKKSDKKYEPLPEKTNIQPILVDLNSADTTALVSVRGIGSLTAGRIVEYRDRLGGFHSVEQLAEVRGVTEQNYERILPQIYLSEADIRKININFAPAEKLSTHPYITAGALRKLLKMRQLKGGWSSLEELVEDSVFTDPELERLRPYLIFDNN